MTALASRVDYADFLATKHRATAPAGFEPHEINPALFPFQRAVVEWAVRLGRAALFADTGTGKTAMQLEWARQVADHSGGNVLILAPLAVAGQTIREGRKFGIDVTACRSGPDVRPGVNIANYEMLKAFDPDAFSGVVLDESSILKSFMGKTKQLLLNAFRETPYRLACTATPAPNDHLELGNHAEFLGVMPSNEMISRWFINDSMESGAYRLKGHATGDFWRWVCSWAACFTRPSDIGFSDEGYILPPLNWHDHVVEVDNTSDAADGYLIRMPEMNATSIHREMRLTVDDRAAKVAELVSARPDDPWIVWCNTDYEADALRRVIPGAVEVRGPEKPKAKEEKIAGFSDGTIRVLITKPSICGYGLNWQHCRNMAFVGLSYSYEDLYQAIRRSWRFGQPNPVEAHVVIAETEGPILETVMAKQAEHEEMKRQMVAAMAEQGIGAAARRKRLADVETGVAAGRGWTIHLGDSCQSIASIADDSVGLTVTSPPFENLYIYSDSVADMGNSADSAEFFDHFRYLIRELRRVTIPGRLAAIHCKDLPMYRGRDGAMGLRDFPGEIVREFTGAGWTFHSRVTVWKCPVIERARTNNHGLLYKNLRADSTGSRQGMADFILVFRKWNEDAAFPAPVSHSHQSFPLERWQRWADPVWPNRDGMADQLDAMADRVKQYAAAVRRGGPIDDPFVEGDAVWMGIDQTDVLNYKLARDASDERHICPLQLDLIERCIKLWSNPGDLIHDPFNGIGSVGCEAVKAGRKYVGIELKRSYFDIAAKNLRAAESEAGRVGLFDRLEEAEAASLSPEPSP